MKAKRKVKTDNGLGLCPRCNKNPATEDHTCPYGEEINNDFDSTCNCCDECAHECAMDI